MSNTDLAPRPAADEPGRRPDLHPDEIEVSYAPTPVTGTIDKLLDGELLVVDGRNGRMHVLNASAAIVWDCLDGTVTIGQLAAELAEAFCAPLEQVTGDVLEVARQLGRQSLLEGVSVPLPDFLQSPKALEEGEPIEPFAVATSGGEQMRLPRSGASSTLLVNWSPLCGFCDAIVPALAMVRPALLERGVELVLLTGGSAEDNRKKLAASGLTEALHYRPAPAVPAAGSDPFGTMGTPAAYLVDAGGAVLAPIAVGAGEVVGLARRAACIAEDEQGAGNALPVASGMCGPGLGTSSARSRVWFRTSAYAVGDIEVGIRTDSARSDELLGRALAGYRLAADVRAPDNFSIVLGGAPDGPAAGSGRGSAALSLLLVGDDTVLRSRSPRRVVEALAAQLSAIVEPPDPRLVVTTNVAAVVEGSAVLLPTRARRRMEHLQGPLARLGLALSDAPHALVDPASCELVVRASSIELDQKSLDGLGGLPPTRSELAPVAPGRYPIAAWLLDEEPPSRPGAPLTLAGRIAGVLPSVQVKPDTVTSVVDALATVVEKVRTAVIPMVPVEQFAERVEALLAEL